MTKVLLCFSMIVGALSFGSTAHAQARGKAGKAQAKKVNARLAKKIADRALANPKFRSKSAEIRRRRRGVDVVAKHARGRTMFSFSKVAPDQLSLRPTTTATVYENGTVVSPSRLLPMTRLVTSFSEKNGVITGKANLRWAQIKDGVTVVDARYHAKSGKLTLTGPDGKTKERMIAKNLKPGFRLANAIMPPLP